MDAAYAGLLPADACKALEQETEEISGMLWGLIKHYKGKAT